MENNEKRILVVDDEVKIVEVVQSYLSYNQFFVISANNGNDALNLFNKESPDLIILDLMLPDISGEDICRLIRRKSKVPIIMLTAKTEEEDILLGLDIGADDYITKPFSPRQLVAKVKALLRRVEEDKASSVQIISVNKGELTINGISYEVRKKGDIVNLTPNEYNILNTLVKYPNKVFTREELISIALGENFIGYDRAVDSHIKNLRQKIESDPKEPEYVLTIRGVGYKFGGLLE
ncbi:MAG: response regulator transcription factor [Bacillota bacterium]|nr:response regulator transcription factor [Bacillota bacterium]